MPVTRLPLLLLVAVCSTIGASVASAQLLGDEVSFERIADNPSGPFLIQYEDATFVVGPGIEYQSTDVLTFDLDDSSITVTTIADTAFGVADPHEWRFHVAPRITGFTLVNSNFGALSESDISFSAHVLTVNVSGLDPDFPGFAQIQLDLQPCTVFSVPAVSPVGLALLAVALGGVAFAVLRRGSARKGVSRPRA